MTDMETEDRSRKQDNQGEDQNSGEDALVKKKEVIDTDRPRAGFNSQVTPMGVQ